MRLALSPRSLPGQESGDRVAALHAALDTAEVALSLLDRLEARREAHAPAVVRRVRDDLLARCERALAEADRVERQVGEAAADVARQRAHLTARLEDLRLAAEVLALRLEIGEVDVAFAMSESQTREEEEMVLRHGCGRLAEDLHEIRAVTERCRDTRARWRARGDSR